MIRNSSECGDVKDEGRKEIARLTTWDWVLPWCLRAKSAASPLPSAALGFRWEGRAEILEAIVGWERVESKRGSCCEGKRRK